MQFAGQYADRESGLLYMRARSYDPASGQFLTRDPVEEVTRQAYAYAGDDPVNDTDPTGLLFGIPGTPSTSALRAARTTRADAGAGARRISVVAIPRNVPRSARPDGDGHEAAARERDGQPAPFPNTPDSPPA